MDSLKPPTPAQTVGPFFHEGLAWLVSPGERTRRDDHEWLVAGRLTDANGAGVADALLEIWQPGRPPSASDVAPGGLQRVYTNGEGRFSFTVRRPSHEAAVAHVTLFARGLLTALRTRLYLEESVDRLEQRAELQHVPARRLETLMPSRVDAGTRSVEWSVHLQGERETVFFDLT
jgi:protocatechuate 3,4-dioxygenase alpha subunit